VLTSDLSATQRILVVGCGLAGLTIAIALRRSGHDIEIVEATEKIGYVGAGKQQLLSHRLLIKYSTTDPVQAYKYRQTHLAYYGVWVWQSTLNGTVPSQSICG
jgi:2-polyprenyl-6-methoxyphenol hydroxylase-like FAD-dependent oxidoreductase